MRANRGAQTLSGNWQETIGEVTQLHVENINVHPYHHHTQPYQIVALANDSAAMDASWRVRCALLSSLLAQRSCSCIHGCLCCTPARAPAACMRLVDTLSWQMLAKLCSIQLYTLQPKRCPQAACKTAGLGCTSECGAEQL